MLKPSGHRLDDKHNLIIKNWARVWKVKDAIALRIIITNFNGIVKKENVETI